MNKKIVAGFVGLTIIMVCVVIAWFIGFPESQVASAQRIRDPEVERQKREWDKSVTDEKLERVRLETEKVKQAIVSLVEKKFPKYGKASGNTNDPKGAAVGRRGQSGFTLNWKRGSTYVTITTTFFFSPAEAENIFPKATNVAMGESFPAPELYGKDAVLVKNVVYNQGVTGVALHFRKGRLIVGSTMTNSFKSNAENEKELLKIMNEIYPLLVAKDNFEDV